jgi:signal transduction histidine kinase
VAKSELKVEEWAKVLISAAKLGERRGFMEFRCVAKEDRERIFSGFYQVTLESPLRGSGLGLALVSRLVDLLKESI